MEPEAPWAVDQAIKSRMGNGAPAGIGTVTEDNAQVEENATRSQGSMAITWSGS